ncbi:MAG: class III extradiol ring-cleavage dioxygenase [Paenibacillus sp.]|uniref:DODA-type extradiol aromatic ring-opening family dioxygenase n=1 Tax=Paenibacillus sp. TaxID=58172 RepID=UPI00290CFA3D|nr:class III extradiol ring-cleavage dioxygenase [Paenibacillus sp.]MDU4697123.1 class III extradiol ring-cleavage dioxygenase [Paenibacillus sp.]
MSQPALFIAHGSPTLAIEQNAYTDFLRQLGQETLKPPNAVVIFSAHWEDPVQWVSTDTTHPTMHDFYGFPEEMYAIEYPAPGSPELSGEIEAIFRAHNLPYRPSAGRGLDHGAWVVLKRLFPSADIPVVALSVDAKREPEEQYAIGKMLAELRHQNILVIGSGGLVHNLRLLDGEAREPAPWAVEFDDWIGEQLQSWDLRQLFDYDRKAPHVRMAIPSYGREHFVPLLYAMGAADDERRAVKLFQDYQYGSLSLNCWRFGD